MPDEEHVSQANALKDAAITGAFQMVAPRIWIYEVVNAVTVAIRRSRISQEKGLEGIQLAQTISATLFDQTLEEVYQASMNYGVASYDASYLHLAVQLNALLWTGDKRFYNVANPQTSLVKWIGDYK